MTQVASFYNFDQIASLDKDHIPQHIAFIPDGNRRWAKQRNSLIEMGHRHGVNMIFEIVKAAQELGVKIVTFYLFSTENWTRPRMEISALMWLLEDFLKSKREEMIEKSVRLQTIGELSRLPKSAQKAVNDSINATFHCNKIEMVLALNYGGRDEICRAFQRMMRDLNTEKIQSKDVNETLLSSYLDTAAWPDPDLLIRTSGELRLSNFLLWQSSYTEIYTTDILWPDFKTEHLLEAIQNYQTRERRKGGT